MDNPVVVAAAAPTGFQQLFGGFLGPMVIVCVMMYLIIVRPQQKKAKEHQDMVNRLKAGDKVVTSGGIHGVVTGAKDKTVMVRVAAGVEIEVSRSAVAGVLGTEQ